MAGISPIDYYEFDRDAITAQAVPGGNVILSFGGMTGYSMTPETARSVILKLVSAAFLADGKAMFVCETKQELFAVADKIRAEEF